VPRSKAENQRVRDEQRARILDGARAVFARSGMAATMAEVAEAAGVSQGLAYRYFASKDELYRALVVDAMSSNDDLRLSASGTPGERLRRLLAVLIEARRDHPEAFQLLYHVMSDPATPPDVLAAVQARGMRFVELLRELIAEGQAGGEVAPDDPGQLVAAIIAAIDGLTRFSLEHPDQRANFPDARIVFRMLAP
jgi:AcrR family transcriptional regulator